MVDGIAQKPIEGVSMAYTSAQDCCWRKGHIPREDGNVGNAQGQHLILGELAKHQVRHFLHTPEWIKKATDPSADLKRNVIPRSSAFVLMPYAESDSAVQSCFTSTEIVSLSILPVKANGTW